MQPVNTIFISSNSYSTNTIPLGQFFYIAHCVTCTPLPFYEVSINGSVNVGANNIFDFNSAPQTNVYNTSTYVFCTSNNTQISQNYYGTGLCGLLLYTGSISPTALGLQSKVIGPPFSANLTIYINPEGYFEYIINNGTYASASSLLPSGSSNKDINDEPYLWVNKPPDSISNAFNLTILGKTLFASNDTSNAMITNGTYKGTVLYSSLIDISPIEYQMLDGNLTPDNFAFFIQNNLGSFYNSTLIYNIKPNPVKTATNIFGISLTLYLKYLAPFAGLFSGSSTNTNAAISAINNVETQVGVSQSIPILLNGIHGYNSTSTVYREPLYVTYAYPSILCSTISLIPSSGDICIQSGQKGMIAFNTYIDNTYAPEIEVALFRSQSIMVIFILTIAIFIVKKLNGD